MILSLALKKSTIQLWSLGPIKVASFTKAWFLKKKKTNNNSLGPFKIRCYIFSFSKVHDFIFGPLPIHNKIIGPPKIYD